MRINRTSRRLLRAQSVALIVALLVLAGLAAWASTVWTWQGDWTWGHRNSLTQASRKVLETLQEPVAITAFVVPGSNLAHQERLLLERYHRADKQIQVRFVNPDVALAEMRHLGINTPGEIYVGYGRRGEKLDDISESGITNALLRLSKGTNAQVVFVTGHGEASPKRERNFDVSRFAHLLEKQGFRVTTRDLASETLPRPTSLVVIAGPQTTYLPSEVKMLTRWVAQGGNLLWLHNPGGLHGLGPLARTLGIKPLVGTIVDTTSRQFGIKDPRALVFSRYGSAPVTEGFNLTTLFPDATGFQVGDRGEWHDKTFLASRRFPASWLVSGGLDSGTITYRPGTDIPGPVPIGIVLTREVRDRQQRVAVVGNVDFLDNSFLGNGGNLNLGLRIFNWLAGQDRFVDISPVEAPDRSLSLSRPEQAGIGFGFLALMPLVFLAVAGFMWLRRRHR